MQFEMTGLLASLLLQSVCLFPDLKFERWELCWEPWCWSLLEYRLGVDLVDVSTCYRYLWLPFPGHGFGYVCSMAEVE